MRVIIDDISLRVKDEGLSQSFAHLKNEMIFLLTKKYISLFYFNKLDFFSKEFNLLKMYYYSIAINTYTFSEESVYIFL